MSTSRLRRRGQRALAQWSWRRRRRRRQYDPWRSHAAIKKRWAGALALLLCLSAPTEPSAAATQFHAATSGRGQSRGPTAVSCGACIVIDERGRVLWQRAAHQRLPNASTTKMLTALVARAEVGLNETASVSSAAGSIGGGGLDLSPGDQMRVEDLLYAMLLSSSNEAAATLAEYVSGSQSAFVARMNRMARRRGLEDSHFVNPHGLDALGHYSSAADLAEIGAAVLADPVLADIVATPRATIQTPRGPSVETNRNVLLEGYARAIGIKTGRTLGAGNVLVAAAQRGRRTLIAVAMRATDAAEDAAAMLDFGFVAARRLDRPQPVTVLARGTDVGTLVFDPGGAATVVVAETVTLDLPRDAAPVTFELDAAGADPPLIQGQEVGTVSVSAAGEEIAQVDVVVADAVAREPSQRVPDALGAVIELIAGLVAAVS